MIVLKHSYISARDRQSLVGGRPSKTVAVHRALAHLKYIQHRPGVDRGEGGREMFGEGDDQMSAQRVKKLIKDMQDSKVVVHKITLAPDINPEDKKAFTREVMKKLGNDKGLDLQWVATEHKNTAHHHIHVIVLGKDKNGEDVRIDKKDYPKIKEYGDRYLERVHPHELERSRSEREKRNWEKQEAKSRARETRKQERIRDGLELPWMHKKIIREQLEPYKDWKAKKERQAERQAAGSDDRSAVENDKPYFQDTIEAAGETWSRENTLKELEQLNKDLWDDKGQWIPKEDYDKLLGWMKEKRELKRDGKDLEPASKNDQGDKEQKDYFDYKGKRYSKDSNHKRLFELTSKLREKDAEQLPYEQYNQLRSWLEDKDRAKWSGILQRQIAAQMKKDFTKTPEQLKALEGGRVLNPLQENVMSNPVTGLFMTVAGAANTVVSWIPVLDNRDRLKEGEKALEDKKIEKHQDYVKADRTPDQKDRDKAGIDKLDEALEDNQKAQQERKEEKKKKQERDKQDDPHMFDPYGRY